MRNKKTIRIFFALVALVLTVILPYMQSLARGQIDLLRTCTLWPVIDAEEFGEDDWEALKTAGIQMDLYCVADVDMYGRYKVREAFACPELEEINEGVTDWQAAALAAAELADAQNTPYRTFTFTGNDSSVELPVGMYLLCPRTISAGDYEYAFLPCLVSLPGNDYEISGDDRWRYSVEVRLKPEKRACFGDLLIQKTLESYNETLGSALFVFQVEAVKGEEIVYSDVLSLCFNKPGEKSLLVKDIPAGAKVTVTEVYSGASYEAVTEPEQTAVILPGDHADAPARVEFVNRYHGGLIPGSGVINHFSYDDSTGNWELKETVYSGEAAEEGADR
ncbi:MAG TPA: hypothetical protein DD414_05265 [Lachnospiraceae bacterium]|nr:hypothetical protein [Lachnospiraceae bacterium]